MRHQGTAKLDKRTKDLVKRLGPDDVAIIDHVDMDRVSAESLARDRRRGRRQRRAVDLGGVSQRRAAPARSRRRDAHRRRRAARSSTRIDEGDQIEVVGDEVLRDGVVYAVGARLSVAEIEEKMEAAKAGLGEQLDRFARNTIEYLEKEKSILTDETWVPATKVEMYGRHVLVVVRGYDFKQDLDALKPYVSEMRPVLVGVDGGADAIMEAGFTPDIIVGDMDSVTDAGAQERGAAHRARVRGRSRARHGAADRSSDSRGRRGRSRPRARTWRCCSRGSRART